MHSVFPASRAHTHTCTHKHGSNTQRKVFWGWSPVAPNFAVHLHTSGLHWDINTGLSVSPPAWLRERELALVSCCTFCSMWSPLVGGRGGGWWLGGGAGLHVGFFPPVSPLVSSSFSHGWTRVSGVWYRQRCNVKLRTWSRLTFFLLPSFWFSLSPVFCYFCWAQ